MKAIIYICHGTRVRAGNNQSRLLAEACMKNVEYPIQEIAYLELATPTIPEALEHCIKKGATEIILMPLLLLEAGHVKKDIPHEVEGIRQKYPYILLHLAKPIGIHSKMIDILVQRIEEKRDTFDKNISILLIGRGSKDAQTKKDIQSICRLLEERNVNYLVQDGYLTATTPHYIDALYELEKKNQEIYVVPYLLFTGLLMKEIAETVRLRLNHNQKYKLCSFIGIHQNVVDVVTERIKEAEGMVPIR